MIQIKNVSKHFGGIKAVENVTLNKNKGSITGLIGPNGAGKTHYSILSLGFILPILGKLFLKERTYLACGQTNSLKKEYLEPFRLHTNLKILQLEKI